MIITLLEFASAFFGIAAAGLWLQSTKVKAMPNANSNDYTIIDVQPGKQDINVLKTIELQVLWNSRAAVTTALAVGLHAFGLLLRQYPA